MAAFLTIGEVATRTGETRDTIRYYERIGLVPKPIRTEAGYRQYREGIVNRLTLIRKPTVAKKVDPLPVSRNTRGRNTPRLYAGRSAHPSSFTSARCCHGREPAFHRVSIPRASASNI